MNLFCNGRMLDADAPLFTAANRGFRYGDGLFETIKVRWGKPLLWSLHWDRLQQGMQVLQLLQFSFSESQLLQELTKLCAENGCVDAARVRLAVYRVEAEIAGYVLEAVPISDDSFQLNEQGWTLSVFSGVQKPIDMLCNLKTANYLPYALAALHATENKYNESLVCNTNGGVCDGSRTNLFFVTEGVLYTPGLDQGCVGGVLRRYLLAYCLEHQLPFREGRVTEADLLAADEIFLTNAVQGIRWVSRFKEKSFQNQYATRLFDRALATIYG